MITDPISNMIISMKNGAMISKKSVVVPFSKMKHAIAMCLKDTGFLVDVAKKTEKNNIAVLELTLAYDAMGPKLHDVKRISKPSRRVYLGTKELHTVKNGHGATILSTPKGILNNSQARKELVGGEALFMIW